MNRIIKFRAWHNKENRWLPLSEGAGSDYRVLVMDLEDCYVSMINNFGFDSPVNFSKDDIELCQFTGLKDKNGKEIYEGDILRVNTVVNVWEDDNPFDAVDVNQTITCKVIYRINGFDLDIIERDRHLNGWAFYDELTTKDSCEVIGNIYENPELLNQK